MLFEANEAALDFEALAKQHRHQFDMSPTRYGGGVAYLLVFNSMVFRVPLWLKRYYAPLLLGAERILTPLQGRRLSCFAIAQWTKKDAPPVDGSAS